MLIFRRIDDLVALRAHLLANALEARAANLKIRDAPKAKRGAVRQTSSLPTDNRSESCSAGRIYRLARGPARFI